MLTAATEEAFYTLKKKCATAPVLAFADLKRPFLLEMDASKYSLGAVLQQIPPSGVCELCLVWKRGQLSFVKAGVLSSQVGCNGTV